MTARAVLDASAAIHLVMDGSGSEVIDRQLHQADFVTAPDLFTCEVASGLLKYMVRGDITADEAARRLGEALRLAGGLVSGRMLASEALVAAATYQHSVYDMMYAVLARRHGATVITLDSRFAETLREMRVAVFCPAIDERPGQSC